MPESLEQLDLLLLTVTKPRRVHQDSIHFRELRYLDLTLAAYIGEDVIIRYDSLDMAEIRVYAQNSFVCRAICQELAGQTISLKEIIHARNQQRKQVRAGLDERSAVVEQFLAVHQPAPLPQPETPPSQPHFSHRLKLDFVHFQDFFSNEVLWRLTEFVSSRDLSQTVRRFDDGDARLGQQVLSDDATADAERKPEEHQPETWTGRVDLGDTTDLYETLEVGNDIRGVPGLFGDRDTTLVVRPCHRPQHTHALRPLQPGHSLWARASPRWLSSCRASGLVSQTHVHLS